MAEIHKTQHNLPHQVAKASTALALGGSLSVLSGLTLTAVIIGLTAVTPLLVIFSPVLVAATIGILLLAASLLSSGGLGVMAAFVFYWLHSYLAGKHPVGADMLDQVVAKLASGARGIKDRASQTGQHLIKSSEHDG
ncbi:oleosin L-like [Argentina anserina]|uniref:oleosin L-like n=1 Tax=Argentina anserina TaxID=57926 RepID=UPI0021764E15|nr:oleosin L-like [Potentilla anserina]